MLTWATPAGTWSIPPPILFLPAGSRQLLLCWGQLEMSEKVPSVCLSSWGKMNNSLPIRRLGDIGQQKVTMSSSLNSNWLNVSHWQARRRDNAVVTFLQRFWRPLHPPPSHLVTGNTVQLLVSDYIVFFCFGKHRSKRSSIKCFNHLYKLSEIWLKLRLKKHSHFLYDC